MAYSTVYYDFGFKKYLLTPSCFVYLKEYFYIFEYVLTKLKIMSHSVITNTRKSLSWVKITGVSSLLFICLFVLCSSQLMAQGNLLISPTRIVFEGQTRIGELSLANTGQDSAKYSISFVQYRMKEDGNYEEITAPDPGQNFADKNIRVFPRSVMLGPNESQVIKLQLIKTEQLEPGEYRSHIYFRAIPNQKALG